MYHRTVAFEWDPAKALANVAKHGVRFAEAMAVFDDDYAITITDHNGYPIRARPI